MIRQTSSRDLPAIKRLMQAEPGFWQENWPEDVLERGIVAAGDLSYVWEEDGQVLGFVNAADLGFRGYLSELIVARPARSRGIGRQLVQTVEQKLRQKGCAILIADVWRGAAGFYRSLGWSEPDALLMRKKLDAGDEGF